MVKLTELAKSYDSKTTKNICELPEVSVDIEIEDDEFEFKEANGNMKSVKQKVAVINNDAYRIPNSVITQLKVILEDNPNLKKFKVKKTSRIWGLRCYNG